MNKDIYLLRAVECAAIAAYKYIGQKNKNKLDEVAVEAIKTILNDSQIGFRVISGEGALDHAPMLYDGQILGNKDKIVFDLAVDPIEGTTPAAFNNAGSISTIAACEPNAMMYIPEMYMEKLFVNNALSQVIDLQDGIIENVIRMQKVSNTKSLRCIILDKPRHKNIIKKLKKLGINIQIIGDGDVLGAIDVVNNYSDFVYGIGGAPEGLLMAALAISSNCRMDSRLVHYDTIWPNEIETNKRVAIEQDWMNKNNTSLKKIYKELDLIKDKTARFFATGITAGGSLKHIYVDKNNYFINSFMASYGVCRRIKSTYSINDFQQLNRKINQIINKYSF